ncbi:MAG: DUF2490 domain-containing protein [Sphingomonadaceae bacterium]
MNRVAFIAAVTAAVLFAPPANAADEIFELWLNPTAAIDLGKGEVELETAQRIRDGRDDTYFVRLWYGQDIARDVSLQGGVEQRWQGRGEERRLLQQLSIKRGLLRSRSRLEQRFVDSDDRMALRFRQRLGVSVPFDASEATTFVANAEGFLTLRSGDRGGQTGLTALRTYIGFERALGKHVEIGLGYMRAQEFRSGAADRVGHAPLVAVGLKFLLNAPAAKGKAGGSCLWARRVSSCLRAARGGPQRHNKPDR